MQIDLTKPINIDGQEYNPEDFYQRKLNVIGVQPTNYEQYVFIDVLVLHNNTKTTQNGEKAGGKAQAVYRYQDIRDIHKFNAHSYPYLLDVVMADVVDKKGDTIQVILFADFSNLQELEVIPRQKKLKV